MAYVINHTGGYFQQVVYLYKPTSGIEYIHNHSGGSRNFKKGFPLVVNPRCRGVWAVPLAAEDVLFFISIQSNKNSMFFL